MNVTDDTAMHILFVVNDLSYFAIHRQPLAKAFLEKGWRVTLASGDAPHGVPHIDPRIELHILPFARHRAAPWRDLRCLWVLAGLLRRAKPDIVHAFTIKAVLLSGFAVIAARASGALVLTFAGLGKIFEPGASAPRRALVTRLLRTIARRTGAWTSFENEGDRQRAMELGFAVSDRSITLAGAGIDPALFFATDAGRDGKLRILMASRLIATKGVDVYLQAAARLGDRAHFTLTGLLDPGDADAMDMTLIEDAARAGRVEWVGATPMEAMGDRLRDHDLVVLPTRLREGFPRSLLEAAACGCALVASKQAVIEQVVLPGRTGWLLDPPDADTLCAALDDAIANPAATRAMGDAAARHIAGMGADMATIASDVAAIYDRARKARA